MCVSPSELQRIHGIWSGQHLVPDWSYWRPGCEGCAGTGRSLTFTFYWCFPANCDSMGTFLPPAASCDRGAKVGRRPGLRALGCDWRLSWRFPVVPSRRPVPRGVQSLRGEEPGGQRRHPAGNQRHSGLVRLERIPFSSPTLLRGVQSCDLLSAGGTPAWASSTRTS